MIGYVVQSIQGLDKGTYIKVGGGVTDDLQRAQVYNSKRRDQYDIMPEWYAKIPVRVEIHVMENEE